MYERILRLRRPRRKTSALLLPVVALLFGLTTLAAGPEPPLEDCFGGALSFEPLHCYVLEQAHDEGVIGIEAIYDTGTSLYVFVKQKDAMSDETGEFLRRKVEEYHDNWPEHLPHGPLPAVPSRPCGAGPPPIGPQAGGAGRRCLAHAGIGQVADDAVAGDEATPRASLEQSHHRGGN